MRFALPGWVARRQSVSRAQNTTEHLLFEAGARGGVFNVCRRCARRGTG
jgi:hypothetical protein